MREGEEASLAGEWQRRGGACAWVPRPRGRFWGAMGDPHLWGRTHISGVGGLGGPRSPGAPPPPSLIVKKRRSQELGERTGTLLSGRGLGSGAWSAQSLQVTSTSSVRYLGGGEEVRGHTP